MNHFNIDISVQISNNSIDLNHCFNGYYLIKRKIFIFKLFEYLSHDSNPIKMISDQNKKCEIFIDYFNHDRLKTIEIL